MFLMIHFFLTFVSLFSEEKSECEVTCKDEYAYMNALVYYIKLPGNQTIAEKNKANPLKEEISKDCKVEEINKLIQCMGHNESAYASSEILEYCATSPRIGAASCIFEHPLSDNLNIKIWNCLSRKTKFEQKYHSFYKIVSNIEYFQENVTKYGNLKEIFRKIFCVIRNDFNEKNPNFTDHSNFLELLNKNEKTVEIYEKIRIAPILIDIFNCFVDQFVINMITKKPWRYLMDACEKFNVSSFNYNAELDNLYPLNETNKKLNETSSKKTTIIIIVTIISIISLICLVAIILYKKNKN